MSQQVANAINSFLTEKYGRPINVRVVQMKSGARTVRGPGTFFRPSVEFMALQPEQRTEEIKRQVQEEARTTALFDGLYADLGDGWGYLGPDESRAMSFIAECRAARANLRN